MCGDPDLLILDMHMHREPPPNPEAFPGSKERPWPHAKASQWRGLAARRAHHLFGEIAEVVARHPFLRHIHPEGPFQATVISQPVAAD
jgi:hypothetical protein